MSRGWLLPIGRLHRLAGRELTTGCRSRRDSSFQDLMSEICASDVSPEDTVGCASPFMKAIAHMKDGSPAMEDFTSAPMPEQISRSEVSPQHTVGFTSQQRKAAIAHSEATLEMKAIAPLKGGACSSVSAEAQYLKYKLSIASASQKVHNLRAKAPNHNQNLPFVARRSFTCQSGSAQSSSAFGSGDSNLFLENLKSAKNKLKKKLDIGSLKAEFRSRFRPLFVLNCLMLPGKLEDHSAAYLHGQIHGFSKHWPLYLSSLDFMERVKSCSEEQVRHLLDYIIERRILISEDWEHTYGNIEVLRYEASSDASFVRGECDAAFEVGTGVAKLALLIWKGSELIYADVIEGIKCTDSVNAEVLAGVALLMKCKDLGFQKLELWSDSKRVVGMISGSESVYMDSGKKDKNKNKSKSKEEKEKEKESKENCLLLRCLQTEFNQLVPVFKPREIMFLTDQLLKLEGDLKCRFEKALEKWSMKLKGQTLFSATNTKWASSVIKEFAETRMNLKKNGFVYKPEHTFFWKVEKGKKIDAVLKLRDTLLPNLLYLKIGRIEEKPALRQMVSECCVEECVETKGIITTFTVTRIGKSEKKPIVVVWDTYLYKECYEEGYCMIVLAEDEEEVRFMKAAKIDEMNISTYLYFNGVEFKEVEKAMNSKEKAKRV